MASTATAQARDPPTWREAERPGRVSYLPHQSMKKVYRSEQARRRLMAEDEAAWRQLRTESFQRERSDAALELLADAFASILCSEFIAPVPMSDGRHKVFENGNGIRITRCE